MADEEHLARLKEGVEAWDQWRKANRDIQPDLSRANLSGAYLSRADLRRADLTQAHLIEADLIGADLSEAHLSGANLSGAQLFTANLSEADLSGADLIGANFSRADLSRANLSGANLSGANLSRADLRRADLTQAHLIEANLSEADLSRADLIGADLSRADFSRADLTQANLIRALLLETNFEGTNLSGCWVYGISARNVHLSGTQQSDLVITPYGEPKITVDNLEVAQFIYLLLHNEKIRGVIETITSKAVLILGRFTRERNALLDAIREALRGRNLLPIMFDFTVPASQTTLETVSILAHMARFVIADLTDAKSILQELQAIVPHSPSVLVQPILLASQEEPGMFDFFRRFPWVLETYRYHSLYEVLASLDDKVITPAEKARERLGPIAR